MRLPGFARIFVLLVFALAIVVVPASAAPQGLWVQPATNLSITGQTALDPQISAASDGTATTVWSRFNGINDIIQAATRPPGGSFGAPVDLSITGRDATDPQVTTAPDGTATAVWYRSNGSNDIVQAATRPPGGTFDPAVNLSATGQDAYYPQITTAPDGTATAVWYRSNGTNQIIQAATRPPGGSFGAPVDLSASGQNAESPQISTAPDGTATAVWYRYDGSNSIIQSISTARPSFLLQTTTTGTGIGTVTSSPAGIDCGTDCSENYLSYTEVTLTATPKSGSTFAGWGGACQDAAGNTCELNMGDDTNAAATFDDAGKARLKVTKLKPKKPKVKRGRTVKLKVTAKNTGAATADSAKLCLKLSKGVKKKLKPKGKTCLKLGSLAKGKSKTKAFKLKATGKAKKGKKYLLRFKLTAKGARTATRAVKVKVK